MTAFDKCYSCGFTVLRNTRDEADEEMELHWCSDTEATDNLVKAHFMRKYGVHRD